MSTATLISPSEYLATSYRPDQELIDGQLLERNSGEWDHSNVQMAAAGYFYIRRREWKIRVLPEQRVQASSGGFRIPDVCIVSRDQGLEQILTTPPLICIEVLSKDDTLRSLQDRVDDFLAFGVPNIWILDPAKQRAYVCSRGVFREPEDRILEVANSSIRIPLAELFADLD